MKPVFDLQIDQNEEAYRKNNQVYVNNRLIPIKKPK